MGLVLKQIKEPDAVYDIKSIKYEDKNYFIASFGTDVRILSSEGDVIMSIPVPKPVYALVPCASGILFLCSDCYFYHSDRPLDGPRHYGKSLGKIKTVLQLEKCIMIIGEGRYMSARISGNSLIFCNYPNDSSFYTFISGTSKGLCDPGRNDEVSLYMLCKSMTSRVLLYYSISGVQLFQAFSEVVKYKFIFHHKGVLYAIDTEGIREAKEEAPLIREMGNNEVSYVFSDEEKGVILIFCKNGEVIRVKDTTFETTTVLWLDGPVRTVYKMDGTYFVGSERTSYFIDDGYNIDKSIFCFGDVHKALFLEEKPVYFSGSNMVKIDMAIPLYRLDSLGGLRCNICYDSNGICNTMPCTRCSGICLRNIFKTSSHRILTYNKFSIINGVLSDPILTATELDSNTACSTPSALYIFRNEAVTRIAVRSSIVNYKDGFAFIYHYDKFYVINLASLEIRLFNVFASVCDILFDNGIVYLVHVGGVPEPLNISDGSTNHALQVDTSFKGRFYTGNVEIAERHCKDYEHTIKQHSLFLEGYPHRLVTKYSEFVSTGGIVYKFINAALSPVLQSYSHILKVVEYAEGLIIHSADETYFYNMKSKEKLRFNVNAVPIVGLLPPGTKKARPVCSTSPFVDKNDSLMRARLSNADDEGCFPDLIFLCNNEMLGVVSFVPFYTHCLYQVSSLARSHLISVDSCRTVKMCQAGPEPSFVLTLSGGGHITYKNMAFVDYAVINRDLFAITACDTSFLHNKLDVIRIKDDKLAVRHSAALDSVPLALAFIGHTIAVVMTDDIATFTVKNGRLKPADIIRGSFRFTYNATFASEKILLIQNKDWSYDIIDIPAGTVKQCLTHGTSIPFVLFHTVGFIEGSKLYYMSKVMDIGEETAAVFSMREYVLIIARSGAFILLYDDELSEYAQSRLSKHLFLPCVRYQ